MKRVYRKDTCVSTSFIALAKIMIPKDRGGGYIPICGGQERVEKANLMDGFRLPRHVIHQEILAERVWSSEIGFAAAHLSHFLDKLNQAVI